jgi:hypothetical protein
MLKTKTKRSRAEASKAFWLNQATINNACTKGEWRVHANAVQDMVRHTEPDILPPTSSAPLTIPFSLLERMSPPGGVIASQAHFGDWVCHNEDMNLGLALVATMYVGWLYDQYVDCKDSDKDNYVLWCNARDPLRQIMHTLLASGKDIMAPIFIHVLELAEKIYSVKSSGYKKALANVITLTRRAASLSTGWARAEHCLHIAHNRCPGLFFGPR